MYPILCAPSKSYVWKKAAVVNLEKDEILGSKHNVECKFDVIRENYESVRNNLNKRLAYNVRDAGNLEDEVQQRGSYLDDGIRCRQAYDQVHSTDQNHRGQRPLRDIFRLAALFLGEFFVISTTINDQNRL